MSNQAALQHLLFRMADDALILAHRNSEWTGLGPILEEDIAFSSIAQDKLGHAQALYAMMEPMGVANPDTIAFTRNEDTFYCCHLVEYPIGGYDFSLVRQFLFDSAELVRYEALGSSSYEPLAKLAAKVRGEIKYHVFHATTWLEQLGAKGSEESRARMQTALTEAYPLALGIFEPGEGDAELVADGVFPGEPVLQERWHALIAPVVERAGLTLPDRASVQPAYGGRKGYHTPYLQPLLDEMTEVFRIDPSAEW